eukprot:703929-Pelagomonas_calceolata.AAC.2
MAVFGFGHMGAFWQTCHMCAWGHYRNGLRVMPLHALCMSKPQSSSNICFRHLTVVDHHLAMELEGRIFLKHTAFGSKWQAKHVVPIEVRSMLMMSLFNPAGSDPYSLECHVHKMARAPA